MLRTVASAWFRSNVPMVDPTTALLVFFLLLLVAGTLFWPRRGFVPRLLRLAGMSERVRLEDALKHLYKGEYAGRRSSVDSVAGAVEIPRSKALRILQRLEDLGYARSLGEGFVLTESGRDYALHVVRTHRLLERYLADRTGVLPEDWHGEAERREHRLTPEERDKWLAAVEHVTEEWIEEVEAKGLPARAMVDDIKKLPGARWFEGAHLNFAENDAIAGHVSERITCAHCHGKSTAHMHDETMMTSPDITLKKRLPIARTPNFRESKMKPT